MNHIAHLVSEKRNSYLQATICKQEAEMRALRAGLEVGHFSEQYVHTVMRSPRLKIKNVHHFRTSFSIIMSLQIQNTEQKLVSSNASLR